jgi:ADP-heptose:LPS heptosyltransferase
VLPGSLTADHRGDIICLMLSARSILLLDAGSFGQSAMLIPALRCLRNNYRDAAIAVAASSSACLLFEHLRLVDQSINLGSSVQGASGVPSLLRLFMGARGKDFDLLIDFNPRVETQLLTRLTFKGRIITPRGISDVLERIFASRSRTRDDDRRSNARSVLSRLGLQLGEEQTSLRSEPEADAQFEKILSKAGFKGGEQIVAFYTARPDDPSSWPVESFGSLGGRLQSNFGVRLVVIDEPLTNAFTRRFGSSTGDGTVKLGAPTVSALLAGLARASAVVTDDPGVAGLATGLGTPVVEISNSSATSDADENYRIVSAGLRATVSVDDVFDASAELLLRGRSGMLFSR